jgi:hypothetical protein
MCRWRSVFSSSSFEGMEDGRRGWESVWIWVRRRVVLRSIIVGVLVDMFVVLVVMKRCGGKTVDATELASAFGARDYGVR